MFILSIQVKLKKYSMEQLDWEYDLWQLEQIVNNLLEELEKSA